MPNFLRLVDLESGQSHEGRGLIAVDEKLCAGLGITVDEKLFYMGWVDWIALYVTNDWAKVRESYADWPEGLAVIDWLAAHYSLNGYAMIGRCS